MSCFTHRKYSVNDSVVTLLTVGIYANVFQQAVRRKMVFGYKKCEV